MPPENRTYIAIDLKSFYASVECQARGLDPLTTNLVVADPARTEKTICLAVTPSLKAYGISGRARLFEVVQKVRAVNARRRERLPKGAFAAASWDDDALQAHLDYEVSYLVAPPRMAFYISVSAKIYDVYLRYIAPEDIHVYSIDEVFIDATDYLDTYRLTAKELASTMIQEVFEATGITAAGGIGTNLYLCKVAMDIEAKHVEPDQKGVRIASLDELSYRRRLWNYQPLTDFWRIGRGYAKKLAEVGLFTMGDIARCSIGKSNEYYNEDLLYKLFGINAELLIDHAWGWESCTMADIKAYRASSSSTGAGQVLHQPYSKAKARLVLQEMTDALALDLVAKELVGDQLVLTVGYDRESLNKAGGSKAYDGPVSTDFYGRQIPKHAHGTVNLGGQTNSAQKMVKAAVKLYDEIVDERLFIRRLNIVAGHVTDKIQAGQETVYEQLSLFAGAGEEDKEQNEAALEREKQMQQAVLTIQKKFGKNLILKGTSLEDGATAKERNEQIGGHKA